MLPFSLFNDILSGYARNFKINPNHVACKLLHDNHAEDQRLNRLTSSRKLSIALEDESALIARARHDPEAFGLLYQRYVDRIYRYLFSHVGEPAEAEDLTAQVFTAAWEGLARYQERGEFSAWLFRIARNKATDYHRNRRVHLSWEAERALTGTSRRDAGDPSTGLERAEDLARLSGLIDRLEAIQVELLRLRFAAELTHAEIASLLGRSEVAIKMALGRLLRQLQAEWEAGNE
jgi:RNA polymerase sigma-70 factor (ECF subfamily)